MYTGPEVLMFSGTRTEVLNRADFLIAAVNSRVASVSFALKVYGRTGISSHAGRDLTGITSFAIEVGKCVLDPCRVVQSIHWKVAP